MAEYLAALVHTASRPREPNVVPHGQTVLRSKPWCLPAARGIGCALGTSSWTLVQSLQRIYSVLYRPQCSCVESIVRSPCSREARP